MGVQSGQECRCGDTIPERFPQKDISECNGYCPGDSNHMCGGPLRMDVYTTGMNQDFIASEYQISKAVSLLKQQQMPQLLDFATIT